VRYVHSYYEGFRTTTRGLLRPVVWWAQLALASPVLAFTLGVGGLATGPTLALAVGALGCQERSQRMDYAKEERMAEIHQCLGNRLAETSPEIQLF